MDTILRNARIDGDVGLPLVDIGLDGGKIAAIEPDLRAEGNVIDVGGRIVTGGFVETHIHLDKSMILDRCTADNGDLEKAIEQVANLKEAFTPDDVYDRGKKTLEKCLLNGTTHMRTHLEVDPVIGLRGLEGILPLVDEYKWAIDIEIVIFPQEGLLNNPGTDELMVEALENGGSVVGGAPYTDSDPPGQIDRIFELARRFDTDIDMHLDFGPDPEALDLDYVCELTDKFDYAGRVTIGHVTKLSAVAPVRLHEVGKRMADSGVALTVLPSTDLYLMGRHMDHNVMRGVTPVHEMLHDGVNCSLSTNNVLNPFTPFGDCSLIRMANLYANICQVAARSDLVECYEMVTERSAKLMRIDDYGVKVGNSADLVVIDCDNKATAVSELANPLWGFKRGRLTFTRTPPLLHRPLPT